MPSTDPRHITVIGMTLEDAQGFIAQHPSLEGAQPRSIASNRDGSIVVEYFETHAFHLACMLGQRAALDAAASLHRDWLKAAPMRRGAVR